MEPIPVTADVKGNEVTAHLTFAGEGTADAVYSQSSTAASGSMGLTILGGDVTLQITYRAGEPRRRSPGTATYPTPARAVGLACLTT
jgi:hypothetical protein